MGHTEGLVLIPLFFFFFFIYFSFTFLLHLSPFLFMSTWPIPLYTSICFLNVYDTVDDGFTGTCEPVGDGPFLALMGE